MTRRVRVALALLVSLAVVGVVAVVALPRGLQPGDGITPDSVAAIKPGMSYAEVEELLGCPPGDYSPPGTQFVSNSFGRDGPKGHDEQWSSRYALATVRFDAPVVGGNVLFVNPSRVFDTRIILKDRLRTVWRRVSPW